MAGNEILYFIQYVHCYRLCCIYIRLKVIDSATLQISELSAAVTEGIKVTNIAQDATGRAAL